MYDFLYKIIIQKGSIKYIYLHIKEGNILCMENGVENFFASHNKSNFSFYLRPHQF